LRKAVRFFTEFAFTEKSSGHFYKSVHNHNATIYPEIERLRMINDIKRSLTMLEKAQDRLARQCYHDPKQYPEIFLEIEKCINAIRSWLNEREMFQSLQYFYVTLSAFIDELGGLIRKERRKRYS